MPASQDVSHALSRVRGVLNPRKEVERSTRDIRLGLERIVRVIPNTQLWQGVHVGGTNGKGSICAYLSGLFTLAGISYGRFVSPAFPEKHHSISINGRHIHPRVFEQETKAVQASYQSRLQGWKAASGELPGPLSPFELETATAFRIFDNQRVQYGIVEVGMGGATDATNVMQRKGVTVISKIDIDHTEYLGNTIEQIAKVKAGIMRPGVPCIVDDSNDPKVIRILREHARNIGATFHLTWKAEPIIKHSKLDSWNLQPYQIQNLKCAALAFRHLFPQQPIDLDRLLEMDPYLPGRLEWVGIEKLTDESYKAPVLVDAAHNLKGVETLANYAHNNLRPEGEPITWVIGFSQSQSKPFVKMLESIIRPHDNVAFVQYKGDETDPPAVPQEMGNQLLQQMVGSDEQIYQGEPNIQDAIKWATSKAKRGHIVVTGSLYLIKEFYRDTRVQRYRETKTLRPGSSQLWRLSQLWRHRPLTKEEYKEFRRAKFQWHLSWMNETMKKIKGGEQGGFSPGIQSKQGTTWGREDDLPKNDNPILPSELDIDEDTPTPKPSYEAIKDLISRARFHQKQLKTYRAALKSISEDLSPSSSTPGSNADALRANAQLFQAQADHHLSLVEALNSRIREHPDAPRQLTLEQSEIFRRPPFRRVSRFAEKTELDADTLKKEVPEAWEEEDENDDTPQEEAPIQVPLDYWGRPIGIGQVGTASSEEKAAIDPFAALKEARRDGS